MSASSDSVSTGPEPAPRDFTFKAADGMLLQASAWLAADTPRSAVALVHGYAEYIGRYAHVADFLAKRGHAVYGYDQRGHGRSPGRRAYVHAFKDYVDDLAVFLDRVREEEPGRPLFLLGHSMGGAVSAQYALREDAALDGLILSSAALDLPTPPALQVLAWLLGRLVPTLPTVKLDRRLISHDAAVIARADVDPLYYRGGIPARTAAELFDAARHLRQHLEHLTLPLFLLHGTADGITRPNGSQACYARARSTDKTLALYPGLYHETFNEPEKARVLKEVAEWLDEHLPGGTV
ncbi:MAG: lysophospholipase [Rhodothermales bacterium]